MNRECKVLKVNFKKKIKPVQYELTDDQKYELALIELVYNIKPFKYTQIFKFDSAQNFIKKHKDYIDKNIIIEKYIDDKSFVCDQEQNFYGVIYKGNDDGPWDNTYYIKNEVLDMDPKEAEEIYYAVTLCDRRKDFSWCRVLEELDFYSMEIKENTYFYINKLIDKIKNKIPIGEYINSLEKSIPKYDPF